MYGANIDLCGTWKVTDVWDASCGCGAANIVARYISDRHLGCMENR
jgi:predicted RNA methylase